MGEIMCYGHAWERKTNAFLNVIIKYFEGEEDICKIFEDHSTNDLLRRKRFRLLYLYYPTQVIILIRVNDSFYK